MIERMEPKVLLLTGTIIISYFLWMDIAVYYQTQARDKPYLVKSKDSSPWSPFQHVTLKLLMSDHANHYVYVPTAEMFDEVTHFTSIFSFVTANMVTWSHMIVSLISARFFISESLCMRRIGVILYEFRTWLDALDGVVARARLHEKHNFVSRHGTSGYFADAVADIVSGFALVISLYIFLLRTLPKKLGVQFTNSLPFTNKSHSPEGDLSFAPTLTKRGLFLKMLLFGILLAVSSNLWDNFIWQYQEVIEVSTSPPDQQARQLEVLKSFMMWIIIWFWRVCNAHALLEMVLISVFIDKLWEFILWIQYIGPLALGILSIVSAIHLHTIKGYIGPIVQNQPMTLQTLTT